MSSVCPSLADKDGIGDAGGSPVVTFHDDVLVVDDLCTPAQGIELPDSGLQISNWPAGSAGNLGGYGGESKEFLDVMNAATNELVRSMVFD